MSASIMCSPIRRNSCRSDLSFGDLAATIQKNNVSRGAGYVERNGEGIVVRSGGRLESVEDIANVVATTRGGVPVKVGDIASVAIGTRVAHGQRKHRTAKRSSSARR